MQDELTAIGIGEEVLTEEGDEYGGAKADGHKAGNEDLSQGNQPRKQIRIGKANSFKEPLKCTLEKRKWAPRLRSTVLLGLQKVHGQCRYQCSRQDVRRDHGKDDSLSERDKEIPGNATEKE